MSEEFDKQLMSIKDQLVSYRSQKDEFKPDPSGSEKPSAIVEPTQSAEAKLQDCIAAKQSGDNMSIEEATAACKGAGSDAEEEEEPKEKSCVEKKMSEGMDEAAAKAACAPKSEDSRWDKPHVGVRGQDGQYNQIVGPYVTHGVTKDTKVAYDAKTGLWRMEE